MFALASRPRGGGNLALMRTPTWNSPRFGVAQLVPRARMDPSDVGAPTRPRAGNGTLTRRVFTSGATRLLPRFHGGGVFAERRVLKGTTWALTPPYASARNRECPAGARRPGEGCYAGYSRISASSVVPVAWRRDDKWAPSAASRPSLSVGASNRPSSEPHTPLRRLRPPGARGQG